MRATWILVGLGLFMAMIVVAWVVMLSRFVRITRALLVRSDASGFASRRG